MLSQHRIDPDLADPWAPEIVLVEQPLSTVQSARLSALINAEPKVTLAAVVVGPVPGAAWSLRGDGSSAERRVLLEPAGLSLSPQWLEPPELTAVVDLIESTGSDDTTPAPWWSEHARQPDPPPDNVTYLDSRSTTWGTAITAERALIMEAAMDPDRTVHHPTLQMLGPIELLGAKGTARTRRQAVPGVLRLAAREPGSTAQAMVAALAVAEGTRRSNMSRLRSWLGTSPEGEAYLPDAYTGRITLHPAVSSDWQRLQILTSTGVNRASDDSLQAALELVRGAPLADAAPGQWHWAEELRTDMISCVRDIGSSSLTGPCSLGTWNGLAGPRRGHCWLRLATSCCWLPGSVPSTRRGTRPRPSGSRSSWRRRLGRSGSILIRRRSRCCNG